MKKLYFALFLFSIFVFLSESTAGTFYVAPNGNDEGTGSFESPWRTVTFAVEQTGAGDTVLVRGGTYRESLIWLRTDRRKAQSRAWQDWHRNRRTQRDPTIPRGGRPRDRHMYEPGTPGKFWVLKAYPGEDVVFNNERPLRIQAPYVRVEGIHFEGTGVGVININRGGGHHVQIVGNRFTGSGYRYGAISVAGDSTLIEGNILEIEGQAGTQDHGIYLQQGSGNIIRNNYISGATGYGIHLFCEEKSRRTSGNRFVISDALVENNVVTNSELRSGMIVATGRGNTLAENIVIRNNIFFNNKGNGIDIRRTVNGIKIYNNTLYNNDGDGITLGFVAKQGGPVENIEIKNNIIVLKNSDRAHINSNKEVVDKNTVDVAKNLFWPRPERVENLDARDNLTAAPGFVNPKNLDLTLQAKSPAVDAGIALGEAYKGQAPDLGALESGEQDLPAVFVNMLHASVAGNVVQLKWRTVSENTRVGFEIERSESNKNHFQKIGFIEGKGPSVKPQEYKFIDDKTSPDTYYYRIKKIDAAGASEYTPKIKVNLKVSEAHSSKEDLSEG